MGAVAGLPAGSGLAGRKAGVARRLLLGGLGRLPLGRLGRQSDLLGRFTLACSEDVGLALGRLRTPHGLALGIAHVACLNHRVPGSLSSEDDRIVGCGASPESREGVLSCLGIRLETIDELAGSELAHEHSSCALESGSGGEK